MIRTSRDLIDGVFQPYVTTLPNLVVIDIMEVQIFSFITCHIIKSSCDFELGVSPLQVTTLPSLEVIGIAEVQIQ